MSRIRSIKPDFFRHEELFEAEKKTRLPLRVAYSGLWTCCDREGRFRWKPRQLKLDVLPYDNLDFEEVLKALENFNFIVKYEIEGEIYGFIPSWSKHQVINLREAKSQIPPPSEPLVNTKHVHARASIESNMQAPSLYCGEEEGKGREGEKEMEGKENISSEPKVLDSEQKLPDEPILISIPLVDKTEFPITQSQVNTWKELYPAVDIMQELRNIVGWNISNPVKRKTRRGILKHINGWLANHQDKGGSGKNFNGKKSIAEINADVGKKFLEDDLEGGGR